MVDPHPDEVILDPAGGSGGFVTASLRHLLKSIKNSDRTENAKRRAIQALKGKIFMVEISRRLVKVAKTAMILNGDGHTGMTQGDSLGDNKNLDKIILDNASSPKIVFTNPPWAGIGEGRITDENVLKNFDLGKRWQRVDGHYKRTNELNKEGVPPELLFLERCIQWLAPNGRLGIVLPKGILDTDTALPARHLIFSKCRVQAVINCHKNTFQPFTGPRPCLLVLEKRKIPVSTHDVENYPIFMAISRKIGLDSEGKPIYKVDDNGNVTKQLDHDLDEISSKFLEFKAKKMVEKERIFSINSNEIDKQRLRMNPQSYLPKLNMTIKKILEIDDHDGWSVTTISQISPSVKIFKPPRLKTENLYSITLIR